MKTLLLFWILLLSFSSAYADLKMKVVMNDHSIREYSINEIKSVKFTQLSDECVMNAFCKDSYLYNFHIINIDSLNLSAYFDNQRTFTIIENGYVWRLILSNIDSINFNYLSKAPSIEWQKSFGGSNDDYILSIQQTSDDGYIAFGATCSKDGDVKGSNGGEDIWVIKLTPKGDIQWQKCLGGQSTDFCNSIMETSDGGFIIGGFIYNRVRSGQFGSYDWLIAKLNSNGDIQWQKVLGSRGSDEIYSIEQTSDGGYIVAGYADNNDGDFSGLFRANILIVKLKSNGDIQWQKSLGGGYGERVYAFNKTDDGGYIVAGYSNSHDGVVTDNHGDYDYYVVKLDSTGGIQWQKSYGGSGFEQATSIQQTSDGGFIVAGYSNSNDGDVTGNHGSYDYWIVKIDVSGNIQWQKSLGGSGYDEAYSIQITNDNCYIINGISNSNDGDVSGNYGANWIVKLSFSGDIIWQKKLGCEYYEKWNYLDLTKDGGYIISAYSWSNFGDITGFHTGIEQSSDNWIVKLDSDGQILWQKSLGGSNTDYPRMIHQTKDEGYIIPGSSYSKDGDVTSNQGGCNFCIVKLFKEPNNAIQTDNLVIELIDNSIENIDVTKIQKITFENVAFVEENYQINDNLTNSWVYPNPATDFLEISVGVNDVRPEQNIEIFSVLGESVLTSTTNPTPALPAGEGVRIDVSSLPQGIYFVKIGNSVSKFVKLKCKN